MLASPLFPVMGMAKDEKACYVCEGSCHAKISEGQYRGGLTACGAAGCTMHGKPFKKVK